MTDLELLSYQAPTGVRAGLLVGGIAFDLEGETGRAEDADMMSVLADWPAARSRIDRAADAPRGRAMALSSLQLAPPVTRPSAIYCAGANYGDHVREMAAATGMDLGPNPKEAGLHPWHFLKTAASLAGTGETVALPAGAQAVDWEVELAAVIGRPARNVSVEEALDHVAGYTVANDLSARDLFARSPTPRTSPFFFDWLAHKAFERSCPLGPWITPADRIGDPGRLKLGLSVNGVVKQASNTSEMIFDTAEQISHLSRLRTLHPGDLVLTGTPAGVGSARNEFLKAGDRVEAWIEGIGALITLVGPP